MTRILWAGLVVGAMVGLGVAVGCSSSPGEKPVEETPADPPIAVPPEDLKALAEGNNEFAIDLYKKLAEKETGNIVISPYSISSALAMTYAGARGKTAEEMARTMHFTLPNDRLHAAMGGSMQSLQPRGKDKPFQLNVANALWGQSGFPFKPEFLDLTKRNYDGGRCYAVDGLGSEIQG